MSAPGRVARHLRAAPDGPVRVLHHVPTALYVEVAGRCVGVVAPGAAQVPCALRLSAVTVSGVSLGSVLAERAISPYVERGTLYLTDDPLVVGRFVDVRVPRIDPDRFLRRAASPVAAPAAPPRPAAEGLAAYTGLPAALDAATLARLVGHGGGLTPLGDDVLCGWLAVLHATGRLDEDTAALVRERPTAPRSSPPPCSTARCTGRCCRSSRRTSSPSAPPPSRRLRAPSWRSATLRAPDCGSVPRTP